MQALRWTISASETNLTNALVARPGHFHDKCWDVLTGSTLVVATLLTLGNLMSIVAGVIYLSYSANHDHLTGALSRNAFMDVLQRMLVESDGKQVTLFIMDLDHFKSINDEHGHPVGDAAIIHFHHVMQQCLRAGDAVGRIGGEEFAMAFVQSDPDESEIIASQIHRALADLPLALEEGERLSFTVSIGVASHNDPVDADQSDNIASTLIKQADEALYEAKANGRDQTVFSGTKP